MDQLFDLWSLNRFGDINFELSTDFDRRTDLLLDLLLDTDGVPLDLDRRLDTGVPFDLERRLEGAASLDLERRRLDCGVPLDLERCLEDDRERLLLLCLDRYLLLDLERDLV